VPPEPPPWPQALTTQVAASANAIPEARHFLALLIIKNLLVLVF
jgi:hypothetical protein